MEINKSTTIFTIAIIVMALCWLIHIECNIMSATIVAIISYILGNIIYDLLDKNGLI